MSQRKTSGMTEKQLQEHADFDIISKQYSRENRSAWSRKLRKMQGILDDLQPIEEEILELMATKKHPLLDKIAKIRRDMVLECVHPYNYLLHKGDHVQCKFCNTNIVIKHNND